MYVRPAYARIDHLDAYMPREDWAKLPGSDVQLRVSVKLMRLRICDPGKGAALSLQIQGRLLVFVQHLCQNIYLAIGAGLLP